jgi:hypothetical protein
MYNALRVQTSASRVHTSPGLLEEGSLERNMHERFCVYVYMHWIAVLKPIRPRIFLVASGACGHDDGYFTN